MYEHLRNFVPKGTFNENRATTNSENYVKG